jgi:hypothetical protein
MWLLQSLVERNPMTAPTEKPDEPAWKQMTLRELVDSQIWVSVMEYTAGTGWTDRARDGLVKNVQESVQWALDQHLPKENK